MIQKYYKHLAIILGFVLIFLLLYAIFEEGGAESINEILFSGESRKELSAQFSKCNAVNQTLKSENQTLKGDIKKLNSKVSSLQSSVNTLTKPSFSIPIRTPIPQQVGEIRKEEECKDDVGDKYLKIRTEECEKLGYTEDSFMSRLPRDCILDKKLHEELYQKELREGKACGGYYFPMNY